MRKAFSLAGAIVMAALLTVPAGAQNNGQSSGASQGQGQQVLPPSAAVRLAVQAMPGSEPLGVKLHGQTYVVRLKQDGSIVQVGVDAVTGAVTPLQ